MQGKEAAQRSSVPTSLKPVQDVDGYCVNRLIGHNWIHAMVSEAGTSSGGNTQGTWEKFCLEGPFLQTISKVSFTNIIATCVLCSQSVYLELQNCGLTQKLSVSGCVNLMKQF